MYIQILIYQTVIFVTMTAPREEAHVIEPGKKPRTVHPRIAGTRFAHRPSTTLTTSTSRNTLTTTTTTYTTNTRLTTPMMPEPYPAKRHHELVFAFHFRAQFSHC